MCVPVMVISFVEAGTRLHYIVSKVGNNFSGGAAGGGVYVLVYVCCCVHMFWGVY